jgi:hypothetical protein
MVSTVFISADPRLTSQVELWMRQSMAEKVRFEAFKSIEDFKGIIEKTNDAEATPPPANQPPALKNIRLFVIDLDIVQQKPIQSILDLQRFMTEKGQLFLGGGSAKVLLMAFEGATPRLEIFQHDAIDDLILKPLDKSVFLQKCEFLLADNPKMSPTFLFRAKTQQVVEIGRDVMIDEVSEFAVSVRSPGPVPEGAFATIHSEIFGTKGARRLVGRVYESVRHPVREGEYAVRFAFFGITPDQLSNVRRFIKANQTQMRTAKVWTAPGAPAGPAPAAANAPGAKPALSKELQEKMALLKLRKFAIIDMNPETLNEAKSAIETGFKGLTVRAFPSYTRFISDLRRLLPETAAKPLSVVAPAAASTGAASTAPTFPGGKKITIVLRGKTFELVKFEPGLRKIDMVLGRPANEWMERGDLFLNSVEKDDRETFEEFLGFVEQGTPGKVIFRSLDANGRVIYLDASGILEKAGADGTSLIRVDLTEIDVEQYKQAMLQAAGPGGVPSKDPSSFRFEAILLDGAFLKPDPLKWYENFVELLRATKVLGPEDQPPKIIVMSDPKTRVRAEDFRIKGLHDFIMKPLDRRFLMQKYGMFFPSLVPSREPEQPPFLPCEQPAKLGKEVIMDEISEFGLNVVHPSVFREKSFMRFYSRLFGEDGEWVSGKYHSAEKLSDSESFRCQFMFFGPSEDLTQRIRRWIREDYVDKKQAGGKS